MIAALVSVGHVRFCGIRIGERGVDVSLGGAGVLISEDAPSISVRRWSSSEFSGRPSFGKPAADKHIEPGHSELLANLASGTSSRSNTSGTGMS